MNDVLIWLYAVYAASLSLITMIMYMIDKIKAKRGGRRIREATLLCMGLIGGAVGGLAGMYIFRHKTKKPYFAVINVIGSAMTAAVAVLLIRLKNTL